MSRRAALEELARRKLTRDAILSECHEMQAKVIVDPSRNKSILAGRRSGKSELDARYLAIAIDQCGFDEWVQYSAKTRILAKDLIMGKLIGVCKRHSLGWNIHENDGVIKTARQGSFRILGFDKADDLEKTAGYKTRLFAADEPHSYAAKLKYLYEQKVQPALGDLRGTFLVNGTPGLARSGWWWQTSTGRTPGFTTWHWTAKQNPRFPRADVYPRDVTEWLEDVLKTNKWTVETAQFRREYLAEWCEDEGELVYPYVDERNGVDECELDMAGLFTLGVDFGMTDTSAWSVQYSAPHSRDVTTVHSEEHKDLLPEQTVDITAALVERFKPSSIVGDGAAKAYIEAYNRRYGHRAGWHMKKADKLGKRGHQQIMANEMRAGRKRYLRQVNAALIDEMSNLVWADETREKEHPGLPNNLCDADLYSFTEHMSYLAQPGPEVISDEERARLERFAAAERRRREEAESDYY